MPPEKPILSQYRIRRVKGLTFADAYGLGLLAKSPAGAEQVEIFEYLSPGAKKIAGPISPHGANKQQKKNRIPAKKK